MEAVMTVPVGDQPPPCKVCGEDFGMPHEPRDDDCLLPVHGYGGRRHPPRRETGLLCCKWCVERHKTWLPEIVDLYATLPFVIEPGSVPDTTAQHDRPKKAAETPVPLRLEVWALLHPGQLQDYVWSSDERLCGGNLRAVGRTGVPHIPDLMTNWAEALWSALGWGDDWPQTVPGAAAALTANAEVMAAIPDLDEYDAELRWMRARLRSAHGLSDGKRPPVGKCPTLNGDGVECAGPLWLDRDGLMRVECGKCGREFDERFLRHLGGMLTDGGDAA